MRNLRTAGDYVGLAGHLLAEAVRPLVKTYRNPHRPGMERTFVAIGARGAFDDIQAEIEPIWKRVAASSMVLTGTFQYDRSFRLHAIPHGDADVLVYAPTNYRETNAAEGLFDFLDEVYEIAAKRARRAVLVQFGSHPDLPSPLSVVREDGEASIDDPAFAVTVSPWCGHERPDITKVGGLMRSGNEGVLDNGFSGATILFALRATGDEAAAALEEAMERFSANHTVVRKPHETPRDVVVVAAGEARVFNVAGDEVKLAPAPSYAPRG